MVARLGRHCLLFHTIMMEGHRIDGPLVVDGFETFEYSQFFPFHINLAVCARSWFIYHFTDSPLRRKGTMTAYQRRRRAELEREYGRPDPKAVERGIRTLLEALVPRMRLDEPTNPFLLHSDEHPAYRRAVKDLQNQYPALQQLRHVVTSSKARRTGSNPLFPVNLTDLLLRHGNANHRRETIAFSKRRQATMERTAVFLVWRDYIKRQAENGPPQTAAMVAGISRRMWTWRDVLRRRLFATRIDLPAPWHDYYAGRVQTAVAPRRSPVIRCYAT